MATALALKLSATSANKVFSKLFAPVRSVSVARGFNTNTSQVEAYDDYNRAVQEDRRNENNYVSRRRDNDFFPGKLSYNYN